MLWSLPLIHRCRKCSDTFRFLLLLAAFVLVAGNAMCAGMTLAVESAKAQYLVDEPLMLTITLKNSSTDNVELPVLLNPAIGFFKLYISEPGGKPKVYSCGVNAKMILPKRGKIFVPGEAVTMRMRLAAQFGNSPSILAKAGTYTFFARYNLWKELPGGPVALRSPDIQIAVKQPAGAEQDAHDFLCAGTKGRPWGYPSGQTAMQARIDRYARLVQQYPTSVYAVHAQAEYACEFLGSAWDDKATTRQEKIRSATQSMEQYQIYTEMAKGTPLEADAMRKYGRSLAILGKVDEAALALEAALLCSTATSDERLEALSWTRLLESGSFRGNLKEAGEKYPLPERTFPLLESARVFGFAVAWNEQAQVATISNVRRTAVLQVGSNTIVIDGEKHTAAFSLVNEKGQVRVSARTLGYLLELEWLTRPVLP